MNERYCYECDFNFTYTDDDVEIMCDIDIYQGEYIEYEAIRYPDCGNMYKIGWYSV